MKKLMIGFGMLVLVLGMAGAASAADITFNHYTNYTDSDGVLTSQYATTSGYTVYNFNDGVVPAGWTIDPFSEGSTNGNIVSGTSGTYAAPNLTDNTSYLSIPQNINNQPWTYTVALGYNSDYFGLYWGSVDTYNKLYFYDDGNLVGTLGGPSVLAATGGVSGTRQGLQTNLYIETNTGFTFDTVKFESTSYAFELDNVVTHRVPEPATMLTLGLALLGLAGLKRKFEL